MAETTDYSGAGLMAIGIFKLIKGILLVIVGIGAFKLLHHDVADVFNRWVSIFHVDPDNRYFEKVAGKLWLVNDRKLKEVGAGTFFYAALFWTEGLGLVLRKRWAEYFTIIVTGSFIPLEIYELTKRFTATRLILILVNGAIVWYLVAHLRKQRKSKTAQDSPRASA
jgi:uncharacterized membrane protein (DUF2068 family)